MAKLCAKLVTGLLIAAAAIVGPIAPAQAATPAEVDAAIKKAVSALYQEEESNGTWEKVATPNLTPGHHDSTEGYQWGGLTGIVTYALLSAGEKPDDPRIESAVKYLRGATLKGVYATAARAQIWSLLPKSRDNTQAAQRDAQMLLQAVRTSNADTRGLWFYYLDKKIEEDKVDNSASQFAVLGVYACEEAGAEIPDNFWKVEDQVWRSHQSQAGGWAYMTAAKDFWGEDTLSMTAAGMATLFLTTDEMKRGAISCIGNPADAVVKKGFDFVGQKFPSDGEFNRGGERHLYTSGAGNRGVYLLFGLQRLGVYSGYRYFNDKDWFKIGSDWLVKEQDSKGRWGGESWETAMGLLFLARARSPIVMNKLDYSATVATPVPPWNQRPRDVANFAHWLSHESEQRYNWQIVTVNSDPADWSDSPILYISGSDELKFSPEQLDKLRSYVDAGGMIVGNADCGTPKFATAFKKLGSQLFNEFEFRELPADHVMYTNQNYDRKKWHQKVGVQGLSNGDRELMLLFPDADPGKAWQLQNTTAKAEQFQVAADAYSYQLGDLGAHYKGDTLVVKPDAAIKTTRQVCVARLQYNGTWNPEPGGWSRLSAIVHNTQKVDLRNTDTKLGDGKLTNAAFGVAHLTGNLAFKLSDAQRAELKKFVDGGGLLVIDAAGGNTNFAASAEAELATMFPDTPLADLPEASPLLSSPIKIDKVTYRKFAREVVGKSTSPRLKTITRNGKIAVVYSPVDLSVGLVGTGVDGVVGYSPQSSVDLMTDIVCSVKK